MFVDICKKLNFPAESIPVLEAALRTIEADASAAADLKAACDSLLCPNSRKYLPRLQAIADKTGIHRYTVDMVVLLKAAERMPEQYAARGLPEDVLWDSMEDLKFKLIECWDCYGIWGTFVTEWFPRFFICDRFKLGRLEFEPSYYYQTADYKGIIKDGDPAVGIHIPSGEPLKREAVLDALHRAYEFYSDRRVGNVMAFVCHSWLLYPPLYEEVFPKGGNLQQFYELFDVSDPHPSENNGDFWRVFNRNFSPEALDEVVGDTRMRKNLITFLKEGKCMGYAFGIILYDGEKIINQ